MKQFTIHAVRRATGWPVLFTLEAVSEAAAQAAAAAMGYVVETVLRRDDDSEGCATIQPARDALPMSIPTAAG